MTSGEQRRHRRLTQLFSHAITLDEVACERFLRALRPEDRPLRADLEQLLARDDGAEVEDPPRPPSKPR